MRFVTDGDEVLKVVERENGIIRTHKQFRCGLLVQLSARSVKNDGNSISTVTIKVVDGLEVARGTDPAEATVLDYGGDVSLTIDGAETTKTLTDGSTSFDLTTEKPAGSTIEIVAESLASHPSESDSATIEVIQA